jgi:hypothetical protein
MPTGPRPSYERADDWNQRRLVGASPVQAACELPRPIAPFGRLDSARPGRVPGQPKRLFHDDNSHAIFAHQERTDSRISPAAVLENGVHASPGSSQRIWITSFAAFLRRLNCGGSLRFRPGVLPASGASSANRRWSGWTARPCGPSTRLALSPGTASLTSPTSAGCANSVSRTFLRQGMPCPLPAGVAKLDWRPVQHRGRTRQRRRGDGAQQERVLASKTETAPG